MTECDCDRPLLDGFHQRGCSSDAPPHDRICLPCGYIVTECRCPAEVAP